MPDESRERQIAALSGKIRACLERREEIAEQLAGSANVNETRRLGEELTAVQADLSRWGRQLKDLNR
jgi:hypothetical protein